MTFDPPSSSGEPARTSASLRWIEPLPATPRNRAPESAVIYAADAKGVREPALIREVAPDYTIDAMRAKVQGVVVLDIVIMADGTVGYGTVTKRLDDGLDKQALIAARQWLFQPAFFEGRPVASSVTLVLEFRLH
jgi:TonB family protein